MPIVDAQVHLWGKGTTLPPHRATPYLADEALRDMDAAGVDRAVLHPPSWDADSNELSVEAARAHPDRFAILGRFALDRPESRALVAGWKEPAGHARPALYVPAAAAEELADRRHHGLAVAGGREGRPARGAAGDRLPAAGRADRRAASRAQADRRPHGRHTRQQGRCRLRQHGPAAGPGEAPQRRRQGHRAGPATRPTPIPSAACTSPIARSTMRSAPSACSGAPTSRACRAPGGSASRISPSCRGSPRPTRS